MTSTELLTRPVRTSTTNPDRLAHYVDKSKIVDAHVLGSELVALCGYRWVPTGDPEGHPVCPPCREAWESLPE